MSIKRESIKVYDMTCTSCEGKVEKSIKKLEGVIKVKASYASQKVMVDYDADFCDTARIKEVVKSAGYSVETGNKYKFIGLFIVAVVAIMLSNSTGGFDMNEKLKGASYFVLFVIGVFTSIHCVGMCGGIMLTQSITKVNKNKFETLTPTLLYNAGRVVAYTAMGAIVGALGSVFSLSIKTKSAMQIFAGIFMIIMGLNMAGFTIFRKINIKLPWSSSDIKAKPKAPFLVGVLNGLMPCGPLQTMQLYALGTGSAGRGALSMFIFALGTLPLMLTFGAISGLLSKGNTKKILKFSGFLVIILGLIMGNRGLSLAGVPLPSISSIVSKQGSSSVEGDNSGKAILKDGYQEVTMVADGTGYTPNILYVKKNAPLKWIIKGEAINPCNNSIVIPSLNEQYTLNSGENLIEFTPGEEDLNFTCWMGMIGGKIVVADDLETVDTSNSSSTEVVAAPSIYGEDLSLVPTERLVKKVEVSDDVQTLNIRGIGYEFEPMVILANKGIDTVFSLDLRAFDTPDKKFEIISIETDETIASAEGTKGGITLKGKFNEPGVYVLAYENTVLTFIEVVEDVNTVNLEEIRAKYYMN